MTTVLADRPKVDYTSPARARRAARDRNRGAAKKLLREAGFADHRMTGCGLSLGADAYYHHDSETQEALRKGVATCKCWRTCAACGQHQAAVRAAVTAAACWSWLDGDRRRGGMFLTLTVPHRKTDDLAGLHDLLLRVWQQGRKSKPWLRIAQAFGIRDIAWAVEHTIGANGWHPQVHAILLCDFEPEPEEMDRVENFWRFRLHDACVAEGDRPIVFPNAVDARPIDNPEILGHYLVKWGIGHELAGVDKAGRGKESMPATALPLVLAQQVGMRRPWLSSKRPEVRERADRWLEFLAVSAERRHWYSSFQQVKSLVPGLAKCTTDQQIIEHCLSLLPEAYVSNLKLKTQTSKLARPVEESSDFMEGEDPGPRNLHLSEEVIKAFMAAWWRRNETVSGLKHGEWRLRRNRWLAASENTPIDHDLAICWLIEDEGIAAAARAIADLLGAEVELDDWGAEVHFSHER